MKLSRYFIPVIAAFALVMTSCERVLGFDEGGDDLKKIAISVIASPDTTLEAIVARTYYAGDIEEDSVKYLSQYRYEASLGNATVTYSVNGSVPKQMTYDAVNYRFRCDYRPAEGDEIVISASEPNYPTATATTVIPVAPSLEILSADKYQSLWTSEMIETDEHRDWYGQDTVVDVTLRMKNISSDGYYRLKVRSSAPIEVDGKIVYRVMDVFTSTDELFKDVQLTTYRGLWRREFSNLFEGKAVNGSEYECTVTSRLRKADYGKRMIIVEVQRISEDLYRYLKSVELYQVTERGAYSDDVQIYSNVADGYGIVGSLSGYSQSLVF